MLETYPVCLKKTYVELLFSDVFFKIFNLWLTQGYPENDPWKNRRIIQVPWDQKLQIAREKYSKALVHHGKAKLLEFHLAMASKKAS